MPPAPFTFQESLRCLVLRLILMVDSVLGKRVAGLRALLAGMNAGHRRRARVARELAKAERCAALLADPDFWADPRTVGKAAEIRRVVGDAGRRALVRRMLWPARVRGLRGAVAGSPVGLRLEHGRCIGAMDGMTGDGRWFPAASTHVRCADLAGCTDIAGWALLPDSGQYLRGRGENWLMMAGIGKKTGDREEMGTRGTRTMKHLIAAAVLLAGAMAAPAAQAQHNHAGHGGVGAVTFANTCAPAVQEDLMRGVAMLHSFWYGEGEATFRAVLARDPGCAIAQWGIASLMMNNPLAGVGATPGDAGKAQAAIDAGRAAGAGSQRERDYIEAVAVYYKDFATTPEAARQAARAKAYEALAARYPGDDEAQIFGALYIAGTQSQADQSFAAYRKSAAILKAEFAKYPEHPGIAHYLIHVYDAPALAADGLASARLYAGLAPDAPHALHMPSHIFTRVGAWEESAATNARSFKAAVASREFGEAYHASDYMVYADLQLARDGAAKAAMEAVFATGGGGAAPPLVYAAAAMPARYAVERADWRGAMQLATAKGGTPFTEAMTWFARSIGAARSGEIAAAEQGVAELAARQQALAAAGNVYWANEVEIERRAAAAWVSFARKDVDAALVAMRDAADREDRNEKHIISPGRVLPARELLGDMLLEAGQPAKALAEYEASQLREPNRFRSYLGAARAAEAAGEKDKARTYYGKLLDLAKTADTARPELVAAKAYLAR